jgi:hypothetical protein
MAAAEFSKPVLFELYSDGRSDARSPDISLLLPRGPADNDVGTTKGAVLVTCATAGLLASGPACIGRIRLRLLTSAGSMPPRGLILEAFCCIRMAESRAMESCKETAPGGGGGGAAGGGAAGG